jgi:hypothetical protein
VTVPIAATTPLAPNVWLGLAGLAITSFMLAFPQGLPAAALQVITPNPLRAQVSALYFLVSNLIVIGLGPTAFALVTDYGFGDPMKLRYSMAIVSSTAISIGVALAWLALKPYRASRDRAEAN